MKRPSATVRVLPLPDLAPGAVRVEVECPEGTTGMTQVPAPGGVELSVAMLITATVFGHEERCGACDTAAAHRQGDLRIRDVTERAWSALPVERARRYAEGRRN